MLDTEIINIAEIERQAKAAGASMNEICAAAGIARSTFTRWKSGESEPNIGKYRLVVEALNERLKAAT